MYPDGNQIYDYLFIIINHIFIQLIYDIRLVPDANQIHIHFIHNKRLQSYLF